VGEVDVGHEGGWRRDCGQPPREILLARSKLVLLWIQLAYSVENGLLVYSKTTREIEGREVEDFGHGPGIQ